MVLETDDSKENLISMIKHTSTKPNGESETLVLHLDNSEDIGEDGKPVKAKAWTIGKDASNPEVVKWRALIFGEISELDDLKPPFDYRKYPSVEPLDHWLNGNQERIV
jgi:hypothetical protein